MLEIVKQTREFKRDRDVLLITGDGLTLPEDLKKFLHMNIDHDACCIGRSIKLYPFKVTHYAEVDADEAKWVLENLEANHPDKGSPIKHTLGEIPWTDFGWDIPGCEWPMDDVLWHGSTALFAVYAGLGMGYPKIVLAGCPIDSKGHWYFRGEEKLPAPPWTYQGYQAWFEFAEEEDAAKVRSFSGYTKTLLGEPSKKWMTL